jgi:hypothetical protein
MFNDDDPDHDGLVGLSLRREKIVPNVKGEV